MMDVVRVLFFILFVGLGAATIIHLYKAPWLALANVVVYGGFALYMCLVSTDP